VYLKKRFIDPDQLDDRGIYTDEYTPRSEPILVKLGDKETAVRMIHADKTDGILSLPTPKNFDIEPDAIKELAHVTRLSDLSHKDVVEISGLASIRLEKGITPQESFDATRQAYATALRLSLDQGHLLWTMNIEKGFKRQLTGLLGDKAIIQIGQQRQYIGPPTIPVALNPQDVVESILLDERPVISDENRSDIQRAMNGVSEKYLSKKLIILLHAHGIETTKEPLYSKLWAHKMTGLYASIIGYSALRFLPVGAVDEFNGSVPVFAGIDIGTAITQVGSMELFFKGKHRAVRALGALGTGASFAAPYAYFWANGDDYPPYVNAIAGGFIALSAALETKKTLKDKKIRKGLEQTDASTV